MRTQGVPRRIQAWKANSRKHKRKLRAEVLHAVRSETIHKERFSKNVKLKFRLKEKTPYIVMTMNVIKTTVGHILEQLLPENMAFTIASFLVEDLEEKEEDYKALCATLY